MASWCPLLRTTIKVSAELHFVTEFCFLAGCQWGLISAPRGPPLPCGSCTTWPLISLRLTGKANPLQSIKMETYKR